jgi:hypothetical protein
MMEQHRATVVLQISVLPELWERHADLLEAIKLVKGVETTSIEKTFASAFAFSLRVQMSAKDKPALRRIYAKVSKVASKSPFHLSSRNCDLNEMF